MKDIKRSQAILRKRKMLLALPVMVLPFLTLAFWSMGGGKGKASSTDRLNVTEGLNLQLPDARPGSEKGMDKLSYYEKADRDSAKKEELLRNDPYHKTGAIKIGDTVITETDSNEIKAYTKIAALDKVINEKNSAANQMHYKIEEQSPEYPSEADRLEQMMRSVQTKNTTHDPEIDQLSGMLDKIMDIQHPERISDQARQNSLKQTGKVFPVTADQARQNISLLVSESETRSSLAPAETGFYSLDDKTMSQKPNTIEAVIHETRTVVNGAVVKLRLVNDVYIDGELIPKGTFIYGKATLNGERLNIEVNSIRFKNSLYPVSLLVYDMDGMDGVFIPGAITRDVAKESSDRAIQGIALNSLDPSIGAQAAGAGIEAAKTLLTRKVKLVKVVVKAGYKVLLKEKKGSY